MVYTQDQFAEKIKAKYPEYADIDNNTLATKMIEKYPEYKDQVTFQQPQKQWYLWYMKEQAQKALAPAVWFAQWVSWVWQTLVWKPIETATRRWLEKLTGRQSQWPMVTEWRITDILWSQKESFGAKAWEEAGKFAWTLALTAWLWGMAAWWGIASRLWMWALKWATQTQISNLATEWKPAGIWETLLGAGIWAVTQWIGEIWWGAKKSLYTKAFSQTQKPLAEKWYELSWKTPWQLVLEQNISPSIKKWLTQIKDKLGNTRKALEETADKAWNFQWSSVRYWLKQDMIEQLWFDKLPKNAKSTKDLLKQVSKIVDDYVPVWRISWSEVVQQIKNINKTLSSKLIWMGIQDPTSSKWFSQALEKWLKTVLDKKIQAWWWQAGKIQELYTEYSKWKLVQSILKDENLRKTLWRQLVWAWAWSILWGISWYEDIKEWNLIAWGLKILWWAVAGKQAMKLSKDPNFLMKLWTAVDNIVNKWLPQIQKWATYLASKIKK